MKFSEVTGAAVFRITIMYVRIYIYVLYSFDDGEKFTNGRVKGNYSVRPCHRAAEGTNRVLFDGCPCSHTRLVSRCTCWLVRMKWLSGEMVAR